MNGVNDTMGVANSVYNVIYKMLRRSKGKKFKR